MTNLASYQLAHPELLAEDTLLQILKDRCIEIPQFKSTDKDQLVEIFKRVALPLPQRKYNDRTYLGRKLISLRETKEQRDADTPNLASSSAETESLSANISDRLKALGGVGTASKKIRLSKTPATPNSPCDDNKRKGVEAPPNGPGCNKRRKITWP